MLLYYYYYYYYYRCCCTATATATAANSVITFLRFEVANLNTNMSPIVESNAAPLAWTVAAVTIYHNLGTVITSDGHVEGIPGGERLLGTEPSGRKISHSVSLCSQFRPHKPTAHKVPKEKAQKTSIMPSLIAKEEPRSHFRFRSGNARHGTFAV
jgi:hypothetical protein